MHGATTDTAVIAANRGYPLAVHRRPFLADLVGSGYRVILATARDAHSESLQEVGCEIHEVRFDRGGPSPAADLAAYRSLRRLYRRLRPRLIHHFHAKPVVLGGLAARAVPEAKIVNTITGLGQAFEAGGLTRWLSGLGYRQALPRAAANVFQNRQDRAFFLEAGWLPPGQTEWIFSDGVDTSRFAPADPSPEALLAEGKTRPAVLMAARLLKPKGVGEYLEAARILRQRHPEVHFLLAGEWDDGHPETFDRAEVQKAVEAGDLEFLGYRPRLEDEIRQSHLFVLPSYYREGLPRVLLEAAACAVPVVTTDSVGCRDGVKDGETGLLVPPRDAQALAAALESLLEDHDRRRRMGAAARRWMQEEFELQAMNDRQLDVYRSIGVL